MTTRVSVKVLGTPIIIHEKDGSDKRTMKPGKVFKHDSLGRMKCEAVVNKEDHDTKEIYCSILQNYYYDKDGKGFYIKNENEIENEVDSMDSMDRVDKKIKKIEGGLC